MIAKTKRTVGLFELAIAATLILIAAAAYRVYEVVPPSPQEAKPFLTASGIYTQFCSALQTRVMDLDTPLSAYLANRDQKALRAYENARKEFADWLVVERRLHGGSSETAAIGQPAYPAPANAASNPAPGQAGLSKTLDNVAGLYTNYVQAADYLVRNSGKPLIKSVLKSKRQAVNEQKILMLGIADEARTRGERTEGAASELFRSKMNLAQMHARVQQLKMSLLLALTGLCILFLLGIYRQRLAQARAILREHTRQQEEQKEKLDKLAHFGQLAQELAHEIKQPLTAINARLYTLQKTLPPTSEAFKDASVITNEIRRLDKVVKDFLLLARPSDPSLVCVTAGDALQEIHDLMASELAQESIQFKFECEPGLHFLADMPQLKQVFINLVKNAAESVGHEGTISLRARKARRNLKGESTEVAVIEVEDTGPGIPAEIQGKIFDPFFSTKKDGTGLGLAIAARIIDKHGGVLEFETHHGKGTIFRIVLPAGQAEPIYEQSTSYRG